MFACVCFTRSSTNSSLNIRVKRRKKKQIPGQQQGDITASKLLRFICLKFARRGCHIWPRIRWRETFIAPATSFSLFLSLLWAIQDPNNRHKQCCTFRLQVFTPIEEINEGGPIGCRSQSDCVWTDIFNNFIDYFIGIYYGLFRKAEIMWSLSFQMNAWSLFFTESIGVWVFQNKMPLG